MNLSSSTLEAIYMFLLALQFATQPLLTQAFAPKGIVRSTYVFVQDVVRFSVSLLLLVGTGSWVSATYNWSAITMLQAAGIPALLYAMQNYCSLAAYQNLSAISYNVLNQTKTLSGALWCYLLLHQRQTPRQILALGVLLVSALIMQNVMPNFFRSSTPKDDGLPKEEAKEDLFLPGVVPVLMASLISGLAGALTEKTLQVHARNSLLLSAEMATISAVFLLAGGLFRQGIQKDSTPVFNNWTKRTWIPVATHAAGGILVGLVTKYSGSVRKGFALILGMFLSGLLQNKFDNNRVQMNQWTGGIMAAVALYLYMVG